MISDGMTVYFFQLKLINQFWIRHIKTVSSKQRAIFHKWFFFLYFCNGVRLSVKIDWQLIMFRLNDFMISFESRLHEIKIFSHLHVMVTRSGWGDEQLCMFLNLRSLYRYSNTCSIYWLFCCKSFWMYKSAVLRNMRTQITVPFFRCFL